MASQLSKIHWSESDLAVHGVFVTPALVDEALATYWESFANGQVGHKKVYVPFESDANGSREGALVGFFGKYSGVKNIHFSRCNSEIGQPPRHVDILLRDNASGQRLISLEGLAVSNGRTGWFAVACMNLLLRGKQDVEVFLFGAGPIAEAVILSLDHGAASRIKCVSVLSRNGISNQAMVEKLGSRVGFRLDAVHDRSILPKATFVITATNAGMPVFESHEIARNAVTLSLGIDDMPADYFDVLLAEGGLLVGDDLVAMEARNVDPLSLYYSRRGMKLTEHGRADGVKGYTEVLCDTALMKELEDWKGPATFMPVGLASLDIAVAAKIYETLAAKLYEEVA